MVYQGYVKDEPTKWQMTFKVNQTVVLSKIFEVMGRMVKHEFIESFQTTKTSLEDVYTAFSRFQHVVDKREKTFVNPVGRMYNINNSDYSRNSNTSYTSRARPSEMSQSHDQSYLREDKKVQ